jgi:hypothetical protein
MKWQRTALICVLGVLAMQWASGTRARAQTIRRDSGQDVAPAFEGWEQNADGSYNFVFGYLNRNYEEKIDIPIGSNNFFDQGPQDRGQPTHFYTRRQRFIFRVVVPKDWDKTRKLVWTLTSRGHTNQAKGWLQPEWELNPGVISENNGGGVFDPANKPPTLTGLASASVVLPNPLKLTASASDDGIPKPRPRRAATDPAAAAAAAAAANPDAPLRRTEGLRIRWIQYRGPGTVTFDPETSPGEYGKPIEHTTTIRFSGPGTYVVRAVASDGQLEATHDTIVTVSSAGAGR